MVYTFGDLVPDSFVVLGQYSHPLAQNPTFELTRICPVVNTRTVL